MSIIKGLHAKMIAENVKSVMKKKGYAKGGAARKSKPRGVGAALRGYGRALRQPMSKDWIQGAIKKPGALKQQLGVPKDEKIPAKKLNAAAKKGGKLGQRARLAKTLRGFKDGGVVTKWENKWG